MGRLNFDEHEQELLKDVDLRSELILREVAGQIATEIKDRRKELGLGQTDLARILGTTQSRVSQLEDETYGKLSLSTLARVADALKCELQVHLEPSSNSMLETANLCYATAEKFIDSTVSQVDPPAEEGVIRFDRNSKQKTA